MCNSKRDGRLGLKITGNPWACFLCTMVSLLPLCHAVFRLGLSVMSLLRDSCSITALQLNTAPPLVIWLFFLETHKYGFANVTCFSEKHFARINDRWWYHFCLCDFNFYRASHYLTHGGRSEVVRLCLTLLSSCSKKAKALLSRLLFPPVFLLHQKKITSPISSQLKLNSK